MQVFVFPLSSKAFTIILHSPFFTTTGTVCKTRYFAGPGAFVVAMVVAKECSGQVLCSPSVPDLCALFSLAPISKGRLLSGSITCDSLALPPFTNWSPCIPNCMFSDSRQYHTDYFEHIALPCDFFQGNDNSLSCLAFCEWLCTSMFLNSSQLHTGWSFLQSGQFGQTGFPESLVQWKNVCELSIRFPVSPHSVSATTVWNSASCMIHSRSVSTHSTFFCSNTHLM